MRWPHLPPWGREAGLSTHGALGPEPVPRHEHTKCPAPGLALGAWDPQTQLLLGWAGVCPDLRSAGRAEAVVSKA